MEKNGFTLIEILFVLTITSILTLIGGKLSFITLHKQYEQHFLNTLTDDIRYIQNLSISDIQTDARIYFEPTQYKVTSSQISSPDYTRTLPKGWEIKRRTFRTITFNSNGTLRNAGTIYIQTPYAEFKVVFPPGKGSYYVSHV